MIHRFLLRETKGRIGNDGSKSTKEYRIQKDAENAFAKTYLEKTGNVFGAQQFVKKPGKYNRINIDYNDLERAVQLNKVPTKLTKPLYELMQLLFVGDVMKSTLIAFCLDLDSMPLGKISIQQMSDCLNLLGEISAMLEHKNHHNQILSASNHFYSCFPQNAGKKRPLMIDSFELVKEKMNLVQSMLEKSQKYDFLTGSLNKEKNLLDVCYEHLEDSAEIVMLNKSSGMYKQICDYVRNTQLHSTNLQLYIYDPGIHH